MTNLIDVGSLPVLDVWGDSVRARRLDGERITLALVELAPDSIVPSHLHENEQMGIVISGSVMFTVGDETRELKAGGMWRIPSDMAHQVTAGPTGASLIDIFAPTRADWDALPSHPPMTTRWPAVAD